MAKESTGNLRNGSPIGYTIIPNETAQDYALSLDAFGFLARVVSLPPRWIFRKTWARKTYGVGREKMDRIIRELVRAGYCKFERLHDAKGRLGESLYTFSHTKGSFDDPEIQPLPPQPKKPSVGRKTEAERDIYHGRVSPMMGQISPYKVLTVVKEIIEKEAPGRDTEAPAEPRQDPLEGDNEAPAEPRLDASIEDYAAARVRARRASGICDEPLARDVALGRQEIGSAMKRLLASVRLGTSYSLDDRRTKAESLPALVS
jgi:hypothetical protein